MVSFDVRDLLSILTSKIISQTCRTKKLLFFFVSKMILNSFKKKIEGHKRFRLFWWEFWRGEFSWCNVIFDNHHRKWSRSGRFNLSKILIKNYPIFFSTFKMLQNGIKILACLWCDVNDFRWIKILNKSLKWEKWYVAFNSGLFFFFIRVDFQDF